MYTFLCFPLEANILHYYPMCYVFSKTFTFSHKPGSLTIYLFSNMKLLNEKNVIKLIDDDHVPTK